MRSFFLGVTFLISLSLSAQTAVEYDSVLAKSLDADEYGMKMYVFVILKTGPKTIEDKIRKDSIFSGHMANIIRLADEGKLVVAGPLMKNDRSYRGIFILNVKTEEEAHLLLQTDPAIRSELLQADVYQWYGSAALPLYLNASKRIEKRKH